MAIENGRKFILKRSLYTKYKKKIDVRQENGYSLLNTENDPGVTDNISFSYMHEKIKILLSVLSIFFKFFFMFLS